PPRRRRLRRPHFVHQLHRHLVEADHRPPLVVRPMINLDHVFHPRHELAARLPRKAPLLLPPRLESVFLSVRRTVSSEIASTTFNSTNLSASSCMVHSTRPAGACEQAIAISRASAAPSSFRSVLGFS